MQRPGHGAGAHAQGPHPPGPGAPLHLKLLSPGRKRTPQETQRASEEKQVG